MAFRHNQIYLRKVHSIKTCKFLCIFFSIFLNSSVNSQILLNKEVVEWLISEQELSAKTPFFSNIRNPIALFSTQAKNNGNMDKYYTAKSKNQFQLISFYVPFESVNIYKSNESAPLEILELDNKKYVKIYIHPSQIDNFKELIQISMNGEFFNHEKTIATPSSSARSLFVLDFENGSIKYIIKTSLLEAMGGIGNRIISDATGLRSAVISREYSRIFKETKGTLENQAVGWSYFPESFAVIPKNGILGGYIYRELPKDTPTDQFLFIPLYALIANRGNGLPTYIEKLFQNSNLKSKVEFVEKFISGPLVSMYTLLSFRNGISSELHQQNVLFAIDKQSFKIAKILIRDMDAHYLDLNFRKFLNINEDELIPKKIEDQMDIFHTNASTSYIIRSYAEQLRFHSLLSILKYFLDSSELNLVLKNADLLVKNEYNKIFDQSADKYSAYKIKHIREFPESWENFKNEITPPNDAIAYSMKEKSIISQKKLQADYNISSLFISWTISMLEYQNLPSEYPGICSYALSSLARSVKKNK
jgi:hypothetical protein